jgi:uroporphyrinogen-III decarboxylase
MITRIDLNVYCAGHLSGNIFNNRIISFPRSFVTEAEALGAGIHLTREGFETVQYLFDDPKALFRLPRLTEGAPVHRVLKQICEAPKDKTLLLKVNGPYSILASLVDPKDLYRWLIKHRLAVHRALDTITFGLADYLYMAIMCGVSILSLADPYANLQVLGEKRYREFAAPCLVTLMKNIAFRVDGAAGKPKVIMHLCPHNSVPLTQLGYLGIRKIPVKHDAYIDALIRPADFQRGLTILGDQCIYTQNTENLAVHYFR